MDRTAPVHTSEAIDTATHSAASPSPQNTLAGDLIECKSAAPGRLAQSVRGADTVPDGSRGWDNGKKVGGRKRHIATDTMGLLLAVVVTAASVQDRDGAVGLLARLRERFSTITLTWADA